MRQQMLLRLTLELLWNHWWRGCLFRIWSQSWLKKKLNSLSHQNRFHLFLLLSWNRSDDLLWRSWLSLPPFLLCCVVADGYDSKVAIFKQRPKKIRVGFCLSLSSLTEDWVAHFQSYQIWRGDCQVQVRGWQIWHRQCPARFRKGTNETMVKEPLRASATSWKTHKKISPRRKCKFVYWLGLV